MNVALTVIGALVVAAVVQDVFTTVLFPSSGRGIIRKPLSRGVWVAFRGIARRLPYGRRRTLLTFGGPVIISVNLVAWVVLLVVGFACIYQPALGDEIRASSGTTDTSWLTAIYYSGFSLTTLGMGDVAATTGGYRLLTIVQAALGFAGMTMAITYFLSVYGNLTARNASAQGLHHRTGATGDPAQLVVGLADGGDLSESKEALSATASYLRHLCQSHSFYPVLRYFHYADVAYALPRILLLSLETATLIRSTVDPHDEGAILRSRSLDELFLSAEDLLARLGGDPDGGRGPTEAQDKAWRRRYEDAVAVLRDAGIGVQPDADGYVRLRAGWDHRLRALAEEMGYRWEDVDVHHD